MANIYVGHPKSINYQEELYPAIKESVLFETNHVVFPHENSVQSFASKKFLKTCCLMIAEGSEHATGLGIELGWADMLHVPILCIYKKGKKIAGSYKVITKDFIEYEDKEDLIKQLNEYAVNLKVRGLYGGIRTSLNSLEVGTKFHVHNGHWDGVIVNKDGVKCVLSKGDDMKNARPIKEGQTLDISIVKQEN